MQPDAFHRAVDVLHAAAEHTFADLQADANTAPERFPFTGADRLACAPIGDTAILTFLDVHGTASEPISVPPAVAYRLTGSPGDEQFARLASDHGAAAAVLSLPVTFNLDRVVCADPAALATSAHPGTDYNAHPGVVTVAAHTTPTPVMPLVRLSLTGAGRITRIAADPTTTPVPPPAARWLRLLLP